MNPIESQLVQADHTFGLNDYEKLICETTSITDLAMIYFSAISNPHLNSWESKTIETQIHHKMAETNQRWQKILNN